jgi:hypothetical protein
MTDQPPIIDYLHTATPRRSYWWFDLPSLIATVILCGAIFFGARLSLALSLQFHITYRSGAGWFITGVQAVARWLSAGGWLALIILPLSVPAVVARLRQGAAPTIRSIRLTVRIAIVLLILLAGLFALCVAMEYAWLIQSVSTTP